MELTNYNLDRLLSEKTRLQKELNKIEEDLIKFDILSKEDVTEFGYKLFSENDIIKIFRLDQTDKQLKSSQIVLDKRNPSKLKLYVYENPGIFSKIEYLLEKEFEIKDKFEFRNLLLTYKLI